MKLSVMNFSFCGVMGLSWMKAAIWGAASCAKYEGRMWFRTKVMGVFGFSGS